MPTSPRSVSPKLSLPRLITSLAVALTVMSVSACGDSTQAGSHDAKSESASSERTLKLSPTDLRSNLSRGLSGAGLQDRFRIPAFSITEGPARNGFQTGVASLQFVGAVDKSSGKIVNLTIVAPTSGANNKAAAADLIMFSCLVIQSLEPSFDVDEAKDIVVSLSKSAMTTPETVQTKYEHGLKISTLFNTSLHALMLIISPAE